MLDTYLGILLQACSALDWTFVCEIQTGIVRLSTRAYDPRTESTVLPVRHPVGETTRAAQTEL